MELTNKNNNISPVTIWLNDVAPCPRITPDEHSGKLHFSPSRDGTEDCSCSSMEPQTRLHTTWGALHHPV
ncbi:hypothetical protein TNIN_473681 [Trichonephila inaurata madagascariensis]|uniref:Uncharacterized protein n=1 Tax=Trichonephila inaurata madagascariensis TaxID=2747483 RepID=A0A8X6WWC5_9ARAC|nr:hypothetical protein TNIN_473681 [Trichonephila inaurata madagascariensis]